VRTTLTIDDDVEALLKQRLRVSGEPLKQAVNKYLRLGMLAEEKRAQPKREPVRIKPFSLGLPEAFHIDSTSELLEKLEDPNWP
jgi:hypothetical protein